MQQSVHEAISELSLELYSLQGLQRRKQYEQ